MVDLLGEFSSYSDGPVSITEEDRNSVYDLTSPYDHNDLQPRFHASSGSRSIAGASRALKSHYGRRGKLAGSSFRSGLGYILTLCLEVEEVSILK